MSAMRSKLRAWWPELAFAAFLGLFLLIRAADGPLFVAFEALVLGAGWAMGFRHRHHPALDAIHETYKITKRLEEAENAARAPARPALRLITRD